MKLDVLAFAAHPDDVELACSGTICKLVSEGKKVGVVDLTRGELGSRGSAELRDQEAAEAAKIMGLSVRENLRFRDGFFKNDEAHQLAIIRMIRRYQPELILINAPADRHPDHGRGSAVVRDAAFLSGLRKIETEWEGVSQQAWRPKRHYFYIQDQSLTPDFVVDITDFFEQKNKAIQAYSSQFFVPSTDRDEPQTYISSQDFWHFLEARAREFGHRAGVRLGEGFISERPLLIRDITSLI
ncbi:MAG: bacillithiol biosynthesis deacetylase BshB1 [Bacteroidota bacterium]